MSKHLRKSPYALPLIMAQLTVASWETVWRRGMMMAQGNCTPAEYRRMAAEKGAAAQLSMTALIEGRDQAAVLAPFVRRARANVKRLRRKV